MITMEIKNQKAQKKVSSNEDLKLKIIKTA